MEFGIELIIGIGVGVALGGILFFSMRAKNGGSTKELEQTITKLSQDIFKNSQEQFLTLAHERMKAESTHAQTDLAHKKETIAQLIEEVRKDLQESQRQLRSSDEARIATFSALSKELEVNQRVIKELATTTEDLKRVLSNNQLRGAFGEQVAENLLKMAGFVTGQDYVFNKEQESTDTRPDFTIFLPDKTRINVDVKFPYQALIKMSATENPQEKEQYLRQFTSDVRQKIKQVTTRDYINPEERTVDFVILFIPNEMIFSFIYDQLNEVWEEAMVKKVVLAGPFSFTALLRMIKQAYANFRYQENIHHIIGLIQKFEGEYEKFSDAIDLLGDRLDSTKKQYEAVSGTRSRQLTKVIDQIKNQNVLPSIESKEIV